jgi:hypothetical protein
MTSMRLDVILAFGFMSDLFMDCYKGGWGGEAPGAMIGLATVVWLSITPLARPVYTRVLCRSAAVRTAPIQSWKLAGSKSAIFL